MEGFKALWSFTAETYKANGVCIFRRAILIFLETDLIKASANCSRVGR